MGGDPQRLVDLAVIADESGWDGFFLWDHLLPGADQPDTHDPWLLLGAMAARTSRVRLGTLVTPVPRRRPWKLAKEVITLDHLSAGRAVLGVGLGIPVELEYGAFGEPTNVRTHAAMLDEALPMLDQFLRGEAVDHDGAHYSVHAQLRPASLQRPRVPIWVAATLPNPRPVARARRWDGIFPLDARTSARWLTPSTIAGLVSSLDAPAGYEILAMSAPDTTAAEFEQAGATWLIDGFRGPDEPFDELLRRVEAGPPR